MNVLATVLLGTVAAIATVFAVLAGTNADQALPAAAVAVAVGGLLLLGIVGQTRWSRTPVATNPVPDPAYVRTMFEAGASGRASLASLLDALDRKSGNSNVTGSPIAEVTRLQGLPREEFRRYLEARVSDLERRT